jgi:hypothetical protein
MLAIFALALGMGLGLASGGAISGLSELRLKGELAIISAFVIQGIARGRIVGGAATAWAMAAWVAASVALIGLLMLNARQPGVLLAAAGTLLNLNVVLANGAMPVVPAAGIRLQAAHVSAVSGGFYGLADAGTVGVWAADVINLGVLGQRYVLSVGDVLLVVGVAVLVARTMTSASLEGRHAQVEA